MPTPRQVHLGHREGESITGLVADEESDLLITGDSGGCVKVWDISELHEFLDSRGGFEHAHDEQPRAPSRRASVAGRTAAGLRRSATLESWGGGIERRVSHESAASATSAASGSSAGGGVAVDGVITQLYHWRAHKHGLCSLDYIAKYEMVLTASSSGSVRLSTLSGALVGTFGQRNAWDLGDEMTCVRAFPRAPHGSSPRPCVARTRPLLEPCLHLLLAATGGRYARLEPASPLTEEELREEERAEAAAAARAEEAREAAEATEAQQARPRARRRSCLPACAPAPALATVLLCRTLHRRALGAARSGAWLRRRRWTP